MSRSIFLCSALVLGLSTGAGAVTTLPAPSGTVTSSVTALGNGSWSYQYTVSYDGFGSDGDALVSFDIPYFSDAGITAVTAPAGWSWSFESVGAPDGTSGWGGTALWQDPADPNFQGAASPFTTGGQVLHWYAAAGGIGLGGGLGGFGYEASYPGTKAPHQLEFSTLFGGDLLVTGDPLIPDSPALTAVPLPAPLWLAASSLFGLLLLGAGRKRGG